MTENTGAQKRQATFIDSQGKKKKQKLSPEQAALRGRVVKCCKEQNLAEATEICEAFFDGKIEMESGYHNQLLYVLTGGSMVVPTDTRPQLALRLFKSMQDRGCTIKEASYTLLLRALCAARQIVEAEQVLETMRERSVHFKLRTHSALMRGYCEVGNKQRAYEVLSLIRNKFKVLAEVDYLPLLTLALKRDEIDEFDALVRELMEDEFSPSKETWGLMQKRYRDTHTWDTAVSVSPEGGCGACACVLRSVDPTPEDISTLMARMEGLVVKDADRARDWKLFTAWFEENKSRFDTVIDGANVGFWKKNGNGNVPTRIDYKQVQRLVSHLEQEGRRVLLILHHRHLLPDFIGENTDIGNVWKEKDMLYTCNSGNNDDWYWIYAALGLGPGGDFVSNDEMRDHNFNLSEHRAFKIWKERHAIKFDFIKREPLEPREMIIVKPTTYSFRMQINADMSWHLPSKKAVPVETDEEEGGDADVSQMETLWMCLRRKTGGNTGNKDNGLVGVAGTDSESEQNPAVANTEDVVNVEVAEKTVENTGDKDDGLVGVAGTDSEFGQNPAVANTEDVANVEVAESNKEGETIKKSESRQNIENIEVNQT
ncbi:hypothetical protein SARC_07854 [Sphaeroforma arctica JP610]|uniref:ribonuclease P n=1 Tax=Sphaeroforma arctica JP610 TaxID=667725 RepID=A0A0L0FUZ6_9EUKA|nr:hypothetical protein SARC_07854 [Sphaeroforma arctica JP610]KNC79763.1 hypothetical protein SARC_07854 [Sphaeroforma arctica JP610]|eukprot:XP_014153665.1 hypothetical protein SARC_07854 [Sphaeroforma arctica JP610]